MAGFRFKKAAAKTRWLRIGFYGRPGSGKTLTALLCAEGLAKREGKRVLYFDTEGGTRFYQQDVAERRMHPKAFDFDVPLGGDDQPLYSKSVSDATAAVRNFDPSVHAVLVIDSITHIWESCQAAQTRANGRIPFGDWMKVKRPYKELLSGALALDAHLIICGREKDIYEDDPKQQGNKIKVSTAMAAEKDTEHEPDLCFRFEADYARENTVASIWAIAVKDRTSLFAGRSIENPTYDTLVKPMLGLLSDQHSAVQSEIQAVTVDRDKLEAEEAEQQQRSGIMRLDFEDRITRAVDGPGLAEVAGALTPQVKEKMLADDVQALKDKFRQRCQELRIDPSAIKPTKGTQP